MRSKFAWLPAVAVLFSTPFLAADDPAPATEEATTTRHTLRYQFAPDQVLRYVVRNTSRIDAQAGQHTEVVEQDSTMTRRHRVNSIDAAGNVDLDVVIERVQLEATAGDDEIKFDSDEPGEVPESLQGIKGTIGKSRGTLRLAPTGNVVDVELADTGASASDLKEAHHDILPLLPEQLVAVGDTWKESFSVDALIETPPFKKPIQLQRLYALRSVENGIATIDERTIVLTPVNDPKLEAQLIRRRSSGTSTIDLNRGLLIRREVTIDNTVVGFGAPNTLMRVRETHEDRLLPAEELAGRPAGKTDTK